MHTRTVRSVGALVALGGVLWGLAWVLSPSGGGENSQVEIWASGIFQLGLLGMLAVIWFSHATGTGRVARGLLAAEVVAVVLAIAWTVPYVFDANRPTTGVLVVLDVFWPLSMLGLVIIGAQVARAARWPAPLRYMPLAASLIIPVDISVVWAPDEVRNAVMGSYLAASYGLLGTLMIRNSHALSVASRPEGSETVEHLHRAGSEKAI